MIDQIYNRTVETPGFRVLPRVRTVALKPFGLTVQASPAAGVLMGDGTVDAIHSYRRLRIE